MRKRAYSGFTFSERDLEIIAFGQRLAVSAALRAAQPKIAECPGDRAKLLVAWAEAAKQENATLVEQHA